MTIRPGMPIDALDTPCLLVDLDRLEANIRTWQQAISSAGARLRPHVKTHKSTEIAHMQLAAGAAGITVAKTSEAEVFAAAGCDDIFIAYPLVGPAKWQRAAHLAHSCALTVGVESEAGARGLSAAAQAAGSTLRVRVEIETGLGRCGVPQQGAAALCRLVADLPGLELDGLYTFRSAFFPGANGRGADLLGAEEGRLMANLAEQLRAEGLPIHEVSAGSTPTARACAAVPGITEVRPGTYVFGDYMMAAKGVISYEQAALSILCTVVSRPGPERATVDGGSKTFSGDTNPAGLGLAGYARVVDAESVVTGLSEEHGVVQLAEGHQPQVGDRLAFYPLHVCPTVNLSDELIGVRGGLVECMFPVQARGRRQ